MLIADYLIIVQFKFNIKLLITMKKILIIAVFSIFLTNIGFAQKQNKYSASEDFAKSVKGTWGLGFQATVLHRSDIKWQYGIYAKHFVTDKWALRTNMRFGRDYAKGTNPNYITSTMYEGNDWNSAPNDDSVVSSDNQPQTVIRKSNFMLVVGAEHRQKLSNRFFGYYGVDVGMGGYGQIRKEYDKDGVLVESFKQNRCCDMTIQPFIGLEFFIGRQISFGLEAGYDVLFKFYRKSIHTYVDGLQTELKEEINQYTSIASHIDFGNCVFGTAKISFYF